MSYITFEIKFIQYTVSLRVFTHYYFNIRLYLIRLYLIIFNSAFIIIANVLITVPVITMHNRHNGMVLTFNTHIVHLKKDTLVGAKRYGDVFEATLSSVESRSTSLTSLICRPLMASHFLFVYSTRVFESSNIH